MKDELPSLQTIGGIGTIGIAILGLLGYIPGMGFLGSIKEGYIPMAPSTAVSFILLGVIFLIANLKQLSKAKTIIVLTTTLLVSVFGILEVAEHFSGTSLNFEDVIVPDAGSLDGVPIARMSPATGAAFFFSGLAAFFFVLEPHFSKYNTPIINLVCGLGIVILLISFVFCLAYLYGIPLLYGLDATVPMALTTALGFLFLSMSILTSQTDAFPIRLMIGSSSRAYLLRFILPLSILSAVLGGVMIIFSMQVSKVNPAFVSASLTVLISVVTGIVATLISRRMGSEIDCAKDIVNQANEALRESEERYRAVAENSQDYIIRYDKQCRHLYQNAAAYRISGFSEEEFIGKTHSALGFEKDLCELWEDKIYQVFKTKGSVYEIFERESVDGKVFLDWRLFPEFDKDGEVETVLAVSRDITEWKKSEEKRQKLEETIQKTQKLESLGVLAGGIAHDFNNVLAGLFGNIELAKMKLPQDHAAYNYIEIAHQAMDRATDLTKQLLTFAKGGEPLLETVDIKKIIKGSVEFNLSGSNVKAVLNLPDDLWQGKVDKGQVSQVIANLTINAKQAMPNGGILTIDAENIKNIQEACAPHLSGDYLKICIQDEGAGISDKYIEKIFDPYFTTKQTGSGLGLATVHSIITKHDGHIDIDSKLGIGTTFTIFFPADLSSDKTMETIPSPATEKTKSTLGRILVMDDEEMIRDLSANMLKSCGYTVDTATDGKEVLEKYISAAKHDNPFDIVIMDLTIPGGVGGKEAINKLCEIYPNAKAVVSSGYATDPIMANYSDYGFKGRLAKPFKLEDMEKELSRVMNLG